MTNHNKHSEWVLDLAIQIDEQSPGFAGALLRSSVEKRHVIAAYLAAQPDAIERAAEVVPFLLSANHQTILSEAFRGVPEGLRGALRRSGPAVREQRFYRVLYMLLSQPRHAEVARCISRIDTLNLTKLRVTNILPPEFCRSNVVEALSNIQAAQDLIASVKLLCGAGADQEKLAAAIRDVRDEIGLTNVINRAMLACRGGEHPVPASHGYQPISTAHELHRMAAKFRNCARRYLVDFLDDAAGHAFAEVRLGQEGAVAHLRRRESGWRLEGIFGPRNAMPSDKLRRYVTEYLATHGIEPPQRGNPTTAWSPVRRITASHLFDFDFE